MPVYTLLTIRYVIALVAMLVIFGRRIYHGVRAARVRDWLAPFLAIAFCYIAGNVALTLTAATSVAFLSSLSLVMMPLLAFFVYRTRLSRAYVPVLAGAVLGLYLLCAKGGLGSFGIGEVFALISAALMASSLVFGASSLEHMDALTLTALQIAVSAIASLIPALFLEGDYVLASTSMTAWGIIIYLAIACTLAGFALQNFALTRIAPRTVALIQCTCPVATAFFAYVLLGEKLSMLGMAGAILILACVTISVWQER